MKERDYVRLDRCQGINRIEEYDEDIKKYKLEDVIGDEWGDETFILDENDVIKSSPNIIDLIELNDVVELFEEDGLDDDEITGYYEVIAITTNKKEIGVRTANGEIDFFPVENLRGIITCEQIKTMEYKCE